MKTVMILGAGVPRAAGMHESKEDLPPLDKDFFDVASAKSPKFCKSIVRQSKKLLGESFTKSPLSLERAVTVLYLKATDSENIDSHVSGFLHLLGLLNGVLAHTTNNLSTGKESLVYEFVCNELVKAGDPKNLTILTFNYDILLENILEEISNSENNSDAFVFPGCYRLDGNIPFTPIKETPEFKKISGEFEGIELLKLHGSMNWQSQHTSNNPKPRALFRAKRPLYVMNAKKLPTSLTWQKGRKLYLKPIITPPVSGKKHVTHSAILPLWKKAANALREADRVIIAGYSCPPMDIEARLLLGENLNLNTSKRVYVIDPDAHSAAKFGELCSVKHITIYSSIKDWVDDAPKYP